MRALLAAVCLLLGFAGPASANGAMSLALGTFEWGPWLVYVAATVLFEALVLGRWTAIPFGRALVVSAWANFLTAVLGGVVSPFFSYPFLGIFGSVLDPNPFGQTLFLFTVFGLASGCVEAIIWWDAVRLRARKTGVRTSRLLAKSLVVHLVGIPLGLAILLVPARPYRGLEMQVVGERHVWLQHFVRRELTAYIGEHEALPPDRTYAEVLQRLRPHLDRFAKDPGLWAAAYWPQYGRFDTGERRRGAMVEWNHRAAAEKLSEGPPRTIWLTRSDAEGWCEGLVMELPGSTVDRTTDPKQLGYARPRRAASR